jgi:hypothetical protein
MFVACYCVGGARFLVPVQTDPGAQWVQSPFTWGKAAVRGVHHPRHLTPRLKKEYMHLYARARRNTQSNK